MYDLSVDLILESTLDILNELLLLSLVHVCAQKYTFVVISILWMHKHVRLLLLVHSGCTKIYYCCWNTTCAQTYG